MLSLGTERIASHLLPMRTDSHVDVNVNDEHTKLNYSYFCERYLSEFYFNYHSNGSSIEYTHALTKRALELRHNFGNDPSCFISYLPFRSNQFSITKVIKDRKLYFLTLPKIKCDLDSINGVGFDIENILFSNNHFQIKHQSSYSVGIFCNQFEVDIPYAKIAVFASNKNLMMVSVQTDLNILTACVSCTFAHNAFSSFLTEMRFFDTKSLKFDIKNYEIEIGKIGLKFDSGNTFWYLRHESSICSKENKDKKINCGIGIIYRSGIFRANTGITYNSANNKWNLSLGNTSDLHISGNIGYKINDNVRLNGGITVGPLIVKHPSLNYTASITFDDFKVEEPIKELSFCAKVMKCVKSFLV